MIIIIMRGENFVAHLDGLGGTQVCRGTPGAHHCSMRTHVIGGSSVFLTIQIKRQSNMIKNLCRPIRTFVHFSSHKIQ
jgi:hypothetical protein